MLRRRHAPSRSRLTTLIALSLLLTLLAAARQPGGPAAPSRAQAPDPPELTLTLYGSTVTYRTLPYTLVSAELADAGGPKAEGIGFGDAEGDALIVFPVGSSTILPGDILTLTRHNDKPLVLEIPDLAVDLDAEGDRIGGRAPAGARLRLSIQADPDSDPVERELRAGSDGRFLLELAGELDLAAGLAEGQMVYDSPEGARIIAPFAALATQVTLGAPVLRGQASPGTRLQLDITKADGTALTIGPALMGGDPSYVMGSFANPPLEAGDRILVRQTDSPLPEAERVYSATLEAVTLEIDPDDGRASGIGPADRTIRVSADSMDEDAARWTTTTGADGSFTLELGGEVDLGPGWRVRAAYEAAPAIGVGAVRVLRKARVGVGLPFGQGRVEPGHVLTVTLRSASGAIKSRGRAFSGDQGDYSMPFGQNAPPAAGDRVEIEIDTLIGDPFVLSVPQLTAASDVDADRVTGQAPPDTRVDVVVTSAPDQPFVSARSGADGSYVADFSGQHDLTRPADGLVRVTSLGGDEFVTTWAAMRIAASVGSTIQSNYVTGNGPVGRFVTAQLLTPAGELVAQSSSPVFTGGLVGLPGGSGILSPQFFMILTNATGQPIQMQPGDRLRLIAGDQVEQIEIPPIDAVVFVESDRITGRTGPDLDLSIRIADSPTSYGASIETRSDAAGRFTVELGNTHDIRFGDFVLLAPQVGGHQVLDTILAPGLVVDLDQAIVLGSLAPGIGVEIRLQRGAETLFEEQTGTDATGAFVTQFPGADGTPFVLQPGDRLSVHPDDPTLLPLELVLPALELDWDVEDDRVSGRTQADGQLTLFAGLAYARAGTFGIAQGWPAVDAGGAFEASFVPRVDLRPGHRLLALLRPPEGHYITMARTLPILNAEHSGPNACGFGAPREALRLQLQGSGQVIAGASATARFDGYFNTVYQDGEGQPTRALAEHRIETTLDAAPVSLELPQLELAPVWQQGLLQGQGPPNATWYLSQALPCAAQQQPSVLSLSSVQAISGQTDAEGNFVTGIPGAFAQPGSGLEVAFYDEDEASSAHDHRFFRQAYRALARIFIHTNLVDGQTNALGATRVTLEDSAGAELASQAVQASAGGYYLVRLGDAGAPQHIEPGHVVELETPGERREIAVEPLEFDWSAGSPVYGSAPPNRPLLLQVRLSSGAYLGLQIASDAEGRFAFTEAEVPPRSAWGLEDVIGIRVTLYTPGGHQIIDQTPSFVGPLPQPEQPARLYLPAAFKGAGGGGLAAQARALPPAVWLPFAEPRQPRPAIRIEPAPLEPSLVPWRQVPAAPLRLDPAADVGQAIERALSGEQRAAGPDERRLAPEAGR